MLLGCTDFGDCSKLLLTQFLYLSPSPANDILHVIFSTTTVHVDIFHEHHRPISYYAISNLPFQQNRN